jgi:uncharacterized protein
MRVLIDGYNLLHFVGLMRTRMGPGEVARARRSLISLLERAHGAETLVCVVFDGVGSAADGKGPEMDQGVVVRYAGRNKIADDVIEELIRRHSAPKSLTVVSDDHRIQRAARRRACRSLGCGEYLEELESKLRSKRPPREQPAKAVSRPDADAGFWLETFAPLERDPELRAFFQLDKFATREPEGADDEM